MATTSGMLIMRDRDGTYRRLLTAIAKAHGYTTYADGLRIATDNELDRIERQQRRKAATTEAKE